MEAKPERRWQSAAELERELHKVPAPAIRWYAVSAAAVLAVLVLAYTYFPRAPKLTEKDTIVLADFDNKTGDPVFDDTLRQGLSVELRQSPFLSLTSERQVQRTLALMGRPKDSRLTSETAEEICERTASTVVLEGSIASVGSQYILGLRARNCNTGSILDQEQVAAARREDILNALSKIARKLRSRLGESQVAVQQHSIPLDEATTSSLEALKDYSTGFKMTLALDYPKAIRFYQRAVQIDNQFAMAYANLGFAYGGVGESGMSSESNARAWQLRDRASDRERFFIDFTYHRQVTGNLEKAFETLELWSQTYPRGAEPDPQDLLGGLSPAATGRLERAIEQSQKSIAVNPDFVIGYTNLVRNCFHAGRFGEAENALRQAAARKLEIPLLLVYQYNLAWLNSDDQQMHQVIAMAKGKRGLEHWIANAEALALARSGHLQDARRVLNQAVDLALQEGQSESAATYQAVSAVWEALYGNIAEAKKNAKAALTLSNGRDVEYTSALALGIAGDLSRSEALADDLDKRFPDDTFSRFTYVPVLRALSTLRDRQAESLEHLQTSLRYELAPNGLNFNFYLGGLHSAYLRGEALVTLHRNTEAMAEFQKVVDHPGIVGADPIGALAHMQLGRVHALSGDSDKAKAAYQHFLTLWKDADKNIPILKQVEAEYAKLQ